MNWLNFLGYAASATVFATFCMKTMIPLRVLAIASNVLFCAYGYFDHIYPVLVLHLALLPINAARLIQIQRLVREIHAAGRAEVTVESLLPFMTPRSYKAADMLIQKGEMADRMFYLAQGEIEVVEVGKKMSAGAIIGEVGLFAPAKRRTASVKCLTDCRVYEVSESKAKELYFQDRRFGFAMLQLIIGRMLENAEKSQPHVSDQGVTS
ncbi:MAG: cyclic nucleotide-binding domain-containing protein [Xanthobacteraceae bacterium]